MHIQLNLRAKKRETRRLKTECNFRFRPDDSWRVSYQQSLQQQQPPGRQRHRTRDRRTTTTQETPVVVTLTSLFDRQEEDVGTEGEELARRPRDFSIRNQVRDSPFLFE